MSNILRKYKAIQKIGTTVEVPWPHSHLLFEGRRKLDIYGDQISLGEDHASVEECQAAITWFVEQLGGKVKWAK